MVILKMTAHHSKIWVCCE